MASGHAVHAAHGIPKSPPSTILKNKAGSVRVGKGLKTILLEAALGRYYERNHPKLLQACLLVHAGPEVRHKVVTSVAEEWSKLSEFPDAVAGSTVGKFASVADGVTTTEESGRPHCQHRPDRK